MLGIVPSIFAPPVNPVGVDFGTDCLRLAQVHEEEGDFRLAAAASAEVPHPVMNDPVRRLEFFTNCTKELLRQRDFRSRQAVLGLPASMMHIEHLRLPPMKPRYLKDAIEEALRGKLPINPADAVLRHVVTRQNDGADGGWMQLIVFAAMRDAVKELLEATASAGLDVVGMNVEPMAASDCFAHVYRRNHEKQATFMIVDLGGSGTRATISRAGKIQFARSIGIGGDDLTRAAASFLNLSFAEARTLRIKLASLQMGAAWELKHSLALAKGADGTAAVKETAERRMTTGLLDASEEDEELNELGEEHRRRVREMAEACRSVVSHISGDLNHVRQQYEATFGGRIDRMIFVGGEARQSSICRQIARETGLPAQVGDPICRMARTTEVGVESGIDRRLPQPAWAAAIGLSMGPRQTRRHRS